MKTLFPQREVDALASEKGAGKGFFSVSDGFVRSLSSLLEELKSTDASFVRCIKPNKPLTPRVCDSGFVLQQLRTCGMLEAVQMMRAMYPSRVPFEDIVKAYQHRLPAFLPRLPPRDFVAFVCAALDVDASDYAVGKTKIFFKAGRALFLNKLCRRAAAGASASARSARRLSRRPRRQLPRRKLKRKLRDWKPKMRWDWRRRVLRPW